MPQQLQLVVHPDLSGPAGGEGGEPDPGRGHGAAGGEGLAVGTSVSLCGRGHLVGGDCHNALVSQNLLLLRLVQIIQLSLKWPFFGNKKTNSGYTRPTYFAFAKDPK